MGKKIHPPPLELLSIVHSDLVYRYTKKNLFTCMKKVCMYGYLFFYCLQLYCPLECECHCYYPLSGMASYLESIVLRHLQLPHLRLSTAPTLPENTNDKKNGISLSIIMYVYIFTLCCKLM